MKQTELYQLNLVEDSDDLSPHPFNENTQAIEAALSQRAHVAVGTYTGSGNVGSDAPNSLTFDFAPQFLFVWGKDAYNVYAMATRGVELRCHTNEGTGYASLVTEWGDKGVSWYMDSSDLSHAYAQLNSENIVYQYLAIG